jgi:hypothetical protein
MKTTTTKRIRFAALRRQGKTATNGQAAHGCVQEVDAFRSLLACVRVRSAFAFCVVVRALRVLATVHAVKSETMK